MTDRYESADERRAFLGQLSPVGANDALPAPDVPSRVGARPHSQPRRAGLRAAHNRAVVIRGNRQLPPHRQAMLDVTARLLIHFENASAQLFYRGELLPDGEPRQLLFRLLDLGKQITENLRTIFGDDDPREALR